MNILWVTIGVRWNVIKQNRIQIKTLNMYLYVTVVVLQGQDMILYAPASLDALLDDDKVLRNCQIFAMLDDVQKNICKTHVLQTWHWQKGQGQTYFCWVSRRAWTSCGTTFQVSWALACRVRHWASKEWPWRVRGRSPYSKVTSCDSAVLNSDAWRARRGERRAGDHEHLF